MSRALRDYKHDLSKSTDFLMTAAYKADARSALKRVSCLPRARQTQLVTVWRARGRGKVLDITDVELGHRT